MLKIFTIRVQGYDPRGRSEYYRSS